MKYKSIEYQGCRVAGTVMSALTLLPGLYDWVWRLASVPGQVLLPTTRRFRFVVFVGDDEG